METLSELLSQNWIILVVVGSALLFIVPWLLVWRYRQTKKQLLANGRDAQAKILSIKASGLTIGASSSNGNNGGNMRGVNLLLEVQPEDGQPYQVKTREQLHLFDISRIAPGMMVRVRIHPKKPNKVVVSQWGLAPTSGGV